MSADEWRPLTDYEGNYEVSYKGRIRSLDRRVEKLCRWGGTHFRRYKGKILKPTSDSRGYLMVSVGFKQHVKVHRAVAAAFIGSRPVGQDVRHRDGCRTNNRADNLLYGTRSQNIFDAVQHGTHYSFFATPEGQAFAKSAARKEVLRQDALVRYRDSLGRLTTQKKAQ